MNNGYSIRCSGEQETPITPTPAANLTTAVVNDSPVCRAECPEPPSRGRPEGAKTRPADERVIERVLKSLGKVTIQEWDKQPISVRLAALRTLSPKKPKQGDEEPLTDITIRYEGQQGGSSGTR